MKIGRGRKTALLGGLTAVASALVLVGHAGAVGPPWGPETPNFNLEVILRPPSGAGSGFGHVKFRQPNDEARAIYLDTWLRDLQPNRDYLLQRQVDGVPDGDCSDSPSTWLTLGEGFTATPITTDDRGTGRAALFRDLDPPGSMTGPPPGTAFDIHFRVVDAGTLIPVLESGCYQFAVSL
jgi:hypothetical protein